MSPGSHYSPDFKFIFHSGCRNAINHNLVVIIFRVYLLFSALIFLTGCLNTEGSLEISGNVADEYTKEKIPGRTIILQGLVENNNSLVPVDAGQFTTDSLGNFTHSLRKIKDAYFYNFVLVGDSDYSFKTVMLGLYEIQQNAKFLTFRLRRLAELNFYIRKTTRTAFPDTLYLSVESDGVDIVSLYPLKIENLGITDSRSDYLPGLGVRWIGGSVASTVRTRVFADRMAKIRWELVRDRKRKEINDTVTCRRDSEQRVYFAY